MNNIDIYFFFWNVGMRFKKILNFFGMYAGRKAITYYAEVHKSPANIFIHKTLMPFAAYYYLLGAPALLKMSYEKAMILRNSIYITLLTHYVKDLHFFKTLKMLPIYLPILYYANINYKNTTEMAKKALGKAFTIMFFAEVIGHTFFEKIQSRPRAVLNAILYAHYFSINGEKFNNFKQIEMKKMDFNIQ